MSRVRVFPPVLFIKKGSIEMKIVNYIKECYVELKEKVTWPTWSELRSSVIVVSIASLIIALVVFLMDFSFQHLLEAFYRIF